MNETSSSARIAATSQPAGRYAAFKTWILAILLPVFFMATGGVYWLTTTTAGLQWLLTTVSRASDDALVFTDVTGSLPSLRIGRVIYQDEEYVVKIEKLAIDWRPRDLLNRTLLIEAFTMDTVEFSSAPSDAPLSLPDTLQLPINVVINQLGIRSLRTFTLGIDTPDFSAQQLVLRLIGSDTLYQFPVFSLTLEQGKLVGRLQIATHAPFDLSSLIVLHDWPAALAADYPVSSYISLHLKGDLKQTRAVLAIQAGELRGHGMIALQPFDIQPLTALNLELDNLDPQRLSAGFPSARLSLTTKLQQTEQGVLQGHLEIHNTQPQPLDRGGLPLQDVRTRLLLKEETLVLDDMAIGLAAGSKQAIAHLAGEIQWHIGDASGWADLKIHQLNPALLDTRLQPENLSGQIELQGDQTVRQGRIQLHDKSSKLAFDAMLSQCNHTITIESLDLSHGNARVSGRGYLQLDADQPFTFEGMLKQFDLSALIDVPHSNLNTNFQLNGHLIPQPAGKIDYTITPSHFDKQPVMGKGVITLSQINQLRHLAADAELRLGDNLLQVSGQLGQAGDRLRLTLSAPHLVQAGQNLRGDLNAHLTFAGRLDQPDIIFEASSTQFSYLNKHQLASIKVKGSWQGETIALDLQAGKYHADSQSYFHKLILSITGTESRHQVSLKADIDQTRQLQFNTSGGLVKNVKNHAVFQWRGAIEQLVLTGAMPVRLITQPAVALSAEQFTLGHTRLAVASGNIDIQQISWTPENWVTQGTFEQITLPAVVAAGETSEPLTVGGHWQLAANRQLRGNILLRRTHGDWVLPLDTPFALGLQALSLELLAEENIVNVNLDVEGTHIGKTLASARIPLQRMDHTWQIKPDAQLNGSLQFNLPDLSWIGPAINENILSSGKLVGNATLTGTLEIPRLQGEIQGQALAFALLDEGLQLQDGKLIARLDQDNFVLDTLSFVAPLEKPSKDRLLKGLELARQSGQIDMNGNYNLRHQLGKLRVIFDFLPLIQQPDRWIVVSGDNRIDFQERALAVTGTILTEVGFLKQPVAGRPTLDDDVMIIGETEHSSKSPAFAVNVDAMLDLGDHFYLRTSGLEGRLAGQLRLRGRPGQPLSAIGSITTRDTRFEAYGQKLFVKRGIVNFDGPLDNPGLNILAVRSNLLPGSPAVERSEFFDQLPHQDNTRNNSTARSSLQVEAGVEVAGTVRNPKIKLVSEPNVPDSEKLSWLILGRAPDAGGFDGGMLLSAASSILGGQSDESMLDKVTRGLGFDDISIRRREGGSSLADQIGTVGKRLSSRAYLSYERGLTNASTGVAKLTYTLFPSITLVTRAGEDSAIDLFYNLSFD